jgi:signal transduction histidine kinase/sensor domain CHASE-containing protein
MDHRPTSASARRAAARFVLPVIILAAGLVGHFVLGAEADRREHQRVDDRAERVAAALKARVNAYGGVLYGVRGLFGASSHVTATEFHLSHESRAVEERYPGVKVVGYADLLERGEVARRVRQVRREVRRSGLDYPRFMINPRPSRRTRRVAPITYLEPQATNEPAFGLDFLSEPQRRTALERALATGKPAATGPVRLIQEPADQRGFLLMLGVWNRHRRATGVAYAGFRMGDLVGRVVPTDERPAALEVYDLGPTSRRALPIDRAVPMYDSDATRDVRQPHDAGFGSHTIRFDVMGRHWAVFYAPDRSLAPDGALLTWLPLAIAALLAGLAAWMLGASLRTERRAVALAERMTQSLRDSQTELARSNAELERFAYVASHDLREPLRTITGFLGLLSRRHRDRLDDEGREFIDLAVAGAKRMDCLIAELLEYSRTGRGDTPSEPTELDAAWSVAVRNLSAAIAETGAEVTAGPLPVVMADRGEMVQVLQNLLGNAIKYHGEGRPRVHAEAFRRGDRWEISVSDDGPGIDPRHHDRIFVLLQRLHRHDEVEGTGMGLAICKKIVEHHGGRIWVDSAEGEGARFTFTLRAAHPAAVAVPV